MPVPPVVFGAGVIGKRVAEAPCLLQGQQRGGIHLDQSLEHGLDDLRPGVLGLGGPAASVVLPDVLDIGTGAVRVATCGVVARWELAWVPVRVCGAAVAADAGAVSFKGLRGSYGHGFVRCHGRRACA